MNYQIVYSFLESYFKKTDKDIIEIFSELLVLFSEEYNEVSPLLDNIQDKTWITIPLEVSKTLLKRLKKRGLIEYSTFSEYLLTEEGKEFKEGKVSKSIIHFPLEAIEEDFKKNNIECTLKDVVELFLSSSIIVNYDYKLWLNLSTDRRNLELFFKYLESIEKKDQEKYKAIVVLLYTGMLSRLLVNKETEINNKTFKSLRVYLDTNIIISLLWFDDEERNQTIQGLLNELKRQNAELFISKITVDEISNLLSNYDPNKYLVDYPVNSLYYRMKKYWKTYHDIQVIIESIESFFAKHLITIDYRTDTNIIKENQYFQYRVESLSKWEAGKQIYGNSIKHDVILELLIEEKRKENKSYYAQSFDSCKFLFLTSDWLLASWNAKNKKSKSIPEIIHITDMATYLRIKNPDILESIDLWLLLNRSLQEDILDNRLREAFLNELANKINQQEISQEDCSALLAMESTKASLSQLQNEISQYDNKIDFSKVFSEDRISEAKTYKASTARKMDFLSLSNIQIKQKQESAESKIKNIKWVIELECQKKAYWYIFRLKSYVVIFVASISLLISWISFISVCLYNYGWLLSVIVSMVMGLWLFKRSWISDFFDQKYNQRVQALIIKQSRKFNLIIW